MNPPKIIILPLIASIAVSLTFIGFASGSWLGEEWTKTNPKVPWGLNTYLKINARAAYLYCGILSLWLGGFLSGVTASLIFAKKLPYLAVATQIAGVSLSALGFNTLDWMLSRIISGASEWTAWVIGLNTQLCAWDFYFYLCVAPLFIGGFLFGLLAFLVIDFLHKKSY